MILIILGALAAGVVLGILGLYGLRRWTRWRTSWRFYPRLSPAYRASGWLSTWRRRPGPAWATASLLVCLLITGVWLGWVALASFETADQRLVALGDVLAGGIFLFALLAGILAVIAYVNSSHRPHLQTSWEFWRLDGTSSVNEIPVDQARKSRRPPTHLPPSVNGAPVPLEPVTLQLKIKNDGDAVAANVTVAVYLEGIFFDSPPAPEPGSGWRILTVVRTGWWQVQWNGRDDLVYQGDVPRTPKIELSGMWAAPEIPWTTWGGVVTLADSLRQPSRQPLHITIARPPSASVHLPARSWHSRLAPKADAKDQRIPTDDPPQA